MVKCNDWQKQLESYKGLVSRMNLGDETYNEIKKLADAWHLFNPGESRPLNVTRFWFYVGTQEGYPEDSFFKTPPVSEAQQSNRILVSGTNVETRDLDKMIQGFEAYQRVARELDAKRGGLAVAFPGPFVQNSVSDVISSGLPEIQGVKPVYAYASRVGSFWERFFGSEMFLDEPDKISVPLAIVATGQMRNYNKLGGETLDVSKRLEQIADNWNIPIKFIDSWAR